MKKTTAGRALACLLLVLPFFIEAQSVRRSVISSIGASSNVGGLRISCTAGQPPNAGTIGSSPRLRQGFQQPPDGSGTVFPGCEDAPLAAFSVDNFVDQCGERFSFDFIGTPSDSTVFSWDFGQNAVPATSTLENPLSIVYTSTGTKVVSLQVTTGDCVSTENFSINVTKASFAVQAEMTDLACYEDRDGTASLSVLNGQLPYTYKWSNGATTSSIDDLAPGEYSFTVTEATGCEFDDVAIVEGPDSIRLLTNITVESCGGNKDGAIDVSVSGGTSPFTYNWSTGQTVEDLTNLAGGTYGITVTDNSGCEKSTGVLVLTVCEGPEFDDLITPNGDGSNDNWVIPFIDSYPNNELEIYNRWGNFVYSKKGYDNSWQGTNNKNQALPVGAYYYVLKLNDPANTVYGGSISILR